VGRTIRRGRRMTEREELEREIYELTQIIGADSGALRSASTSATDKANLRRAVEMRAARLSLLQEALTSLLQSNRTLPRRAPA
jgi:hypothetical protein